MLYLEMQISYNLLNQVSTKSDSVLTGSGKTLADSLQDSPRNGGFVFLEDLNNVL